MVLLVFFGVLLVFWGSFISFLCGVISSNFAVLLFFVALFVSLRLCSGLYRVFYCFS